jgi:predicted  nucleic acid-binding Zn-ribbon protein
VTGYDELQKAREELANQISRPLLSRYERLRAKLKRAIVPVKNDICLGCFLRQPTSLAARGREDEEIFTAKIAAENAVLVGLRKGRRLPPLFV